MIERSDWISLGVVAAAFALGYAIADRMAPVPDPEDVAEDVAAAHVHSSVRESVSSLPAGQEEVIPDDTYVAPRSAPGHAAAIPSGRGDGQPAPWRRFAVAPPAADGRPRIVIVIDDMGVDAKRTARAIRLPGPLTMAFLAYAPDGRRQAAAARAAGHELLVHLPMEPLGDDDPGPDALATSLTPDELRARVARSLDRFSDYVGVSNHMGSKFTADRAAMTIVLTEIKNRGLLFLDSRTTKATIGAALAEALGVPFVERNVFLDNVEDRTAVDARLAEAEDLARRHGTAVAIGHPRDATLAALEAWLPSLDGRGLALAPVSAVVHEDRSPEQARSP